MATTEQIDAAAADWLASLDSSDPPATLRAEFEAWCQADPRHYAAYLRLRHVWDRLDRLSALQPQTPLPDSPLVVPDVAPDPDTEPATPISVPAQRMPGAARVLSRLAVAAVLLGVAVGVWLWLWPQSFGLGTPAKRYSTPVGGFERIGLADGSVVQLNTSSEVRVVLSKARREVRLLQGEASFEVARDPNRPFIVTADATAVRALGTNFNVRRTSGAVEVLIIEGAVAVGPVTALNQPGVMPVVGAGRVALSAASEVQLKDVDVDEMARRLAWQHGMLGFNGQPLAEVAAEFNRYNERKLVIASAAVANLRIGGYFRATNLEAFVAVIEERFGIAVTRKPGEIILADAGNGSHAR